MGIPDFDDAGNLPPGRHESTEDEIAERLVGAFSTSTTRTAIFQYWRQHRRALDELVEVRCQWLDGSFVSAKTDPADVDIVTVVEGSSFDEMPPHRRLLVTSLIGGHYTEDFWQCDAYPVVAYPRGHLGHPKFRIACERWEDYFGHDRDGSPKGFLVVP
ncbi:MAG TPA: hypothetical protein VM324_06925 [Egibacteraceae bacterium]|jgi:hypothetical protein|nr:hypothetical protein [Egibacteraceae bacterium]